MVHSRHLFKWKNRDFLVLVYYMDITLHIHYELDQVIFRKSRRLKVLHLAILLDGDDAMVSEPDQLICLKYSLRIVPICN